MLWSPWLPSRSPAWVNNVRASLTDDPCTLSFGLLFVDTLNGTVHVERYCNPSPVPVLLFNVATCCHACIAMFSFFCKVHFWKSFSREDDDRGGWTNTEHDATRGGTAIAHKKGALCGSVLGRGFKVEGAKEEELEGRGQKKP